MTATTDQRRAKLEIDITCVEIIAALIQLIEPCNRAGLLAELRAVQIAVSELARIELK